jgi:hypothetical protein
MFKNRVHAELIAFGKPCPVSDLFAATGRDLLAGLHLPELWASNVEAALTHRRLGRREQGPRGRSPDHRGGSTPTGRFSPPCREWSGLGNTITSKIGDTPVLDSRPSFIGRQEARAYSQSVHSFVSASQR